MDLLFVGRNTILSRFPTGALTGIFLIALCIMPASADNMTDFYTESAMGSHPWVEQFPGIPDRHLNLTINSSIISSSINDDQSNPGYKQVIHFRSDARITESPHGGSVIPADRIIRSSASFTNLSENLTMEVRQWQKFPLAGPVDPVESLSVVTMARFPGSIDYILIGVINPGYAINEGLSGGVPGPRRSSMRGNDPYHEEFDHRQGFFSTPTNSSFIHRISGAYSYNQTGRQTYPYPGPASFTYTYTVDYCRGDPLPGFCPAGVERLTQTIRFARAPLPEGIDEISAHDYPFAITGSTLEVEDAR